MPSYLHVSLDVAKKLATKHGVSIREIEQCFENRSGNLLIDTRARHRTIPPTYWFLASTNKNRVLKVVYILIEGRAHIKTAYEPNDEERRIYAKFG